MYQSGSTQQQAQLRVTNQVGQTNPNQQVVFPVGGPQQTLENTRASIHLNQTQRQTKLAHQGKPRGASNDLHYKLQLPEIMQQQQTKINQMK